MNYTSTRDRSVCVTAAEAITRGISAEGGLFVPCEIPQLSKEEIMRLSEKDYIGRAVDILGRYLTDFSVEELTSMVTSAYGKQFDCKNPAPLHQLKGKFFIQELWHGPTCAFKDMALQLLPYLLTASARKFAPDKTIVILVATSGDTGKAALEGFRDVDGTKIMVFYPVDGVSNMQKLQMITQEGENVSVCAIEGNFDDAQNGVKSIFTDAQIIDRLRENNMEFSSANSINWGRLVPQIVYYVSAYCDLLKDGAIEYGEPMNVTVPTGNFGNILAAYYAKRMGIPVGRLVCASNANCVLTDFIQSGVYDRNRKFYTTSSPSMDILISSNLERLLYHLSGESDQTICALMQGLKLDGKYTVSPALAKAVSEVFVGYSCDDNDTAETIAKTYDNYGYLIDTHTAVAVRAAEQYAQTTEDENVMVVESTASAYKFTQDVLAALKEIQSTDDFEKMQEMSRYTKTKIPAPLAELSGKKKRFFDTCKPHEMPEAVLSMLKIM